MSLETYAVNVLNALAPEEVPDARVESLKVFFSNEIQKARTPSVVTKDHEGAQLAMLAINALATDNRLDERRTKILDMLDQARILLDGVDFENLPSPPGEHQDETKAAAFLTNVHQKRFTLSGVSTNQLSILPQMSSDDIENMTFCNVTDGSALRYAVAHEGFGWSGNVDIVMKLTERKISLSDVDTFVSQIVPKGLNTITYDVNKLINPGLTWLADAKELEALTTTLGSNEIASSYRDRAGLSHLKDGDHLFATLIPGRLLKSAGVYRPRFCDNARYPWFMVGAPDEAPSTNVPWEAKHMGQACCLENLRQGKFRSGMSEWTVFNLHGSEFKGEPITIVYLGQLGRMGVDNLKGFIDNTQLVSLRNQRAKY